MNLSPFVCFVLAAVLLPPLTVTAAEFTVPPVEEINRQGMCDRTPLMLAVRRGNAEEVRALLAAGANPNIPEWHNNTPLMHACQHGYTDIVRMLLAAGADVNARDVKGGDGSHGGMRLSKKSDNGDC